MITPSKVHINSGASSNVVLLVQQALGFGNDGEVPTSLLDVSREFAFSSENSEAFAEWYLSAEALSKFQEEGEDSQRREKALKKFWEFEQQCATTNGRFAEAFTRSSLDLSVLRRARRLCAEVLGPLDREQVLKYAGFGPGATSEFRRRDSSHQTKWERSTHVTRGALPYYLAFSRFAAGRVPPRVEVVAGNRVFTVPKRYDIDRTVCAEPTWNMFFQKGYGSVVRQSLNRIGLLKPDAQAVHQRLAREGSITGKLATADLRGASDTGALLLYEAILPDDHFRLCLELRSEEGELDGRTFLYEKISSMGNGFTFELETLIFWCLVVAACGRNRQKDVSVYGDDLIFPTECASAVYDALEMCGFTINMEKSFVSGPFRESCGGHFWNGVNVTPFYLRRKPRTMNDFIVLGNNIMNWHIQQGHQSIGDPWMSVLRSVRRAVPRAFWGPYGAPGALWAEWDECRPRWSSRTQTFVGRKIVRQLLEKDISSSVGGLRYKLWGEESELESSWLSHATSREVVQRALYYRDEWTLLPVRHA